VLVVRIALLSQIIAGLALGACNQATPGNPNSTVKIKLPASQPNAPKPGFSGGSAPDNVVNSDFQANSDD
jgi:hypothetical protein